MAVSFPFIYFLHSFLSGGWCFPTSWHTDPAYVFGSLGHSSIVLFYMYETRVQWWPNHQAHWTFKWADNFGIPCKGAVMNLLFLLSSLPVGSPKVIFVSKQPRKQTSLYSSTRWNCAIQTTHEKRLQRPEPYSLSHCAQFKVSRGFVERTQSSEFFKKAYQQYPKASVIQR